MKVMLSMVYKVQVIRLKIRRKFAWYRWDKECRERKAWALIDGGTVRMD